MSGKVDLKTCSIDYFKSVGSPLVTKKEFRDISDNPNFGYAYSLHEPCLGKATLYELVLFCGVDAKGNVKKHRMKIRVSDEF